MGPNLTGGSSNINFPLEIDQIEFIRAGSEIGKKYGLQSQGSGRMPGFGNHAHRGTDQAHRRIRAGSLDAALLALNWEPQLRGIIIIIISTTVLCGSVYLILGTNIGARLGFLLSLAGLAGWMMLMGLMWWAFGIGLKGEEPSWKPVAGEIDPARRRTRSYEAGVISTPVAAAANGVTYAEQAAAISRSAARQRLAQARSSQIRASASPPPRAG